MTLLLPLPVVLPLLGAAVALGLARFHNAQRLVSVATMLATLVVAIVLLVGSYAYGTQVARIGDWPPPVGIVLVGDRLSTLMLVMSVAVTTCVLLYSVGEGLADSGVRTPLAIYQPTYLVLTAGVTDTFLSGDLFNVFVGFEVLLAASYVLLTMGATRARIRAGTTYVIISLVSSLVFLVALGLIYASTGTLNMAQLAGRLDALPAGLRLALQLMLLLAFGIKAAAFPLSAWLPDSYPTAPAPVTAVFAGLLTKVGIYAIIRTQTLLFSGRYLGNALMVVALLTMLVGILGAIAQSEIKRLLSFTLVSHIGYLLFGVGLGSAAALSAAIFFALNHINVQTTLFLVAGLIERRGGTTQLARLGGLARLSPLLAVLFFIPALSLSGVPPLPGFVGKVALMQAGITDGGVLAWMLVAGSAATSLLTLYAIMKVWNLAFWRTPRHDEPARVDPAFGPVVGAAPRIGGALMPAGMVVPTAILVLIGLGLALAAGPIFAVTQGAATDLIDQIPYVRAVFPAGVP